MNWLLPDMKSRAPIKLLLVAVLAGAAAVSLAADPVAIETDSSWKCAAVVPSDWNTLNYEDSAWAAADPSGRYADPNLPGVPPTLGSGARPIWHPDNPETAYFRKTFTIDQPIPGSSFYVFVDGTYEVHLNGELVAWSDQPRKYSGASVEIAAGLRPGRNVLTVKAVARSATRSVLLSARMQTATVAEVTALRTPEGRRHASRQLVLWTAAGALALGILIVALRIPRGPFRRWLRRAPGRIRDAFQEESLWVFLLAFFVLGSFIRTSEPNNFNIHHSLVEALAERGHFYVDGSDTRQFVKAEPQADFTPGPDGKRYSIKAPGVFMLGAVSYLPLHQWFGVSYRGSDQQYQWACAWVTLLTTTLLTALTVTLIYRLARQISGSRAAGFFVAGAYGFGTIAFPYSGLLHHDQTGAFFYGAAFYFAFQSFHREPGAWIHPVLAGVFLGLGPLFSFSGFFVGVAVGLYFLSFLHWRKIIGFAVGLAVGAVPLMAVNWTLFGGPFTTVYQFRNDPAAQMVFSAERVLDRLSMYFTDPASGIFYYSPILALTVPGLIFFPRGYVRERLAIVGAVVLTCAYLMVASTEAGSQFGTRLILPFLPLLSLGLVPFWMKREPGRLCTWPWRTVFILLLLASVFFCGLGACVTTMYDDGYVRRWNAWYIYFQWIVLKQPVSYTHGFSVAGFPFEYWFGWFRIPVELMLMWSLFVGWRKEKTV